MRITDFSLFSLSGLIICAAYFAAGVIRPFVLCVTALLFITLLVKR